MSVLHCSISFLNGGREGNSAGEGAEAWWPAHVPSLLFLFPLLLEAVQAVGLLGYKDEANK